MKRESWKTYEFNGKFLGLSLNLKGISAQRLKTLYVTTLILNVIAIFVIASLFQLFWSWYIPVFWEGAPELSYWHAFATVLLLLFLKGGKQ